MYRDYLEHLNIFQNVDIIVFPEDGLTTYTTLGRHELYNWTTIIPAASDNFIPCTNTTIDVSMVYILHVYCTHNS